MQNIAEYYPKSRVEAFVIRSLGSLSLSKSDKMVLSELIDGQGFAQFNNVVVRPGGLSRDVLITHDKDDSSRITIESTAQLSDSKQGCKVRCKYIINKNSNDELVMSGGVYQTETCSVIQQTLDIRSTAEYDSKKLGEILHACLDHKLHRASNAA